MRITAEAKIATDNAFWAVARLFITPGGKGHHARNTRRWNCNGNAVQLFPCKEAIAASLISDALTQAQDEFQAGQPIETLEEDLVHLHLDGLKRLREYRKFLSPAAGPFSPAGAVLPERTGDRSGEPPRAVERSRRPRHRGALPAVTLQLY
jgi:hypothetical protein